MTDVEIIGMPVGNYVRAIRMACEEKGIAYTVRSAAPHSPDILAISPVGKMPVMRHGDVGLCESRAMITYLDAAFPAVPLIPKDPVLAALTEQWISIVNTTMDRTMIRDYVLAYVIPRGPDGEPDRAAIELALPALRQQLGILDEATAGVEFLVGDELTYADINLMPILAAVRSFPEGARAIAEAPNLTTYFERLSTRPSFVKTAA